MKESVTLRTIEKGAWRVIEMFNYGDELIIALPHRVSIILYREATKLRLACDLGMSSSSTDLCQIGEIDISKPNYQAAVALNPEFMARARSFENHFHVEKFIRFRKESLKAGQSFPPSKVFGKEWQDQVYVQLAEPTYERIANIEFSVLSSDYMDEERLSKPMFTLCGSLQLRKEIAHYFFFIDWFGDDFWLYEKNFFYNNTMFPPTLKSLKPLYQTIKMENSPGPRNPPFCDIAKPARPIR
ncbi:MAG: hypothetical protein Q7R84_03410 [bacterium]|nr:hypothetical protein [bacterium]